MPRRPTFDTVPLDQIQDLIAQAERFESDGPDAKVCRDCGHSVNDHNIENDTCWYAIQGNGTVELCKCRGYRAAATEPDSLEKRHDRNLPHRVW
jgi:hypothetical protein